MIPETLLAVPEPLATALHQRGFRDLTPVQRAVIGAVEKAQADGEERRWCINRGGVASPPPPGAPSGDDRAGFWPAEGNHPIQDVASHHRLSFLGLLMTSTKSVANDRFVSEEGVLHTGLLVIPRFLLPPAAPNLLHPHDCAITRTG